jgi:hypothetical protein
MRFDWLTWSNPVSVWWGFLLVASIVNVSLWLLLSRRVRASGGHQTGLLPSTWAETMVMLAAAYVFVCAFRATLPRADVQRICLFDTWLSSVIVGRSVATIAEICFALQWAIVLHLLARSVRSDLTRNIANAVIPLILIAEGSSWYAVISTSYLGNVIENSLWAVTFLLIAIGLLPLLDRFVGVARLAIGSAIVGIIAYLAFMATVDVPMYFVRWQADVANGKELLGLFAGLHDASTRWTVTHDISQWRDEIAWKSLYFSAAVWSSLALGGFGLVKDQLPNYRRRLPRWPRWPAFARALRQWLWPQLYPPLPAREGKGGGFTHGSAQARAPRPPAKSPASR